MTGTSWVIQALRRLVLSAHAILGQGSPGKSNSPDVALDVRLAYDRGSHGGQSSSAHRRLDCCGFGKDVVEST
jgi:hypothetical protein